MTVTLISRFPLLQYNKEVFDDVMLSALGQGRFVIESGGLLISLNHIIDNFKFPVNCEIVKYLKAHHLFENELQTY